MTFPKRTWRLIQTAPARGAWNMAVDEALLEQQNQPEAQPVLRLYAWEPPCLSLGYAQTFADVDTSRLLARGWDVVRRPTGGRAILHTDELTYSVMGPNDEPALRGGVIESYKWLSAAILEALKMLKLPVSAQPGASAPVDGKGPVCFEVPSNYEITAQGKKLVGSAQARRRAGVLQHGTLPLYGDLARITDGLVFPDETSRAEAGLRVHTRAITVEEVLGQRIEWEAAAEAFHRAFEQVLNLELAPGRLTREEQKRAEELAAEKYARPEWTERM